MPTTHRAWARTADAAKEPVSLAEAKAHLREDSTAADTTISALIVAARQYVEEHTGRALLTQTWSLVLDCFPTGGDQTIRLPRPPLVSVVSIVYVAGDGTSTTWGSANYRVDGSSEPARITLAYDATWPTARDVSNAVTITYQAGYGAAAAVPDAIKQAMYLLIGHWYTSREAEVVGTVVGRLGFAVDALLAPYRVYGFGN
jgi:uncharacterized phiE125 gp8 family phage protein